MAAQPVLSSPRLVLRPFHLADSSRVQALAGHPDVAATTADIPHPYPDGAAEEWISGHAAAWAERSGAVFAITLAEARILVGAMALMKMTDREAEVGYWIGVEHWGRGYASEALTRLTRFALEELKLQRLYAHHLLSNPASGRVLEKAGYSRRGQGIQQFGLRHRGKAVARYEISRSCTHEDG